MAQPINVVVTGAAGQMAYSLLYQLAAGSVFGKDQLINLRLLEVKPMIGVLKGVIMELEDLALPIIKNYVVTADAEEAFKDGDAAFLTATSPLQILKERRDLLPGNVGILKEQGEAIDKTAKKSIKVVVITNPVNTGTLVCQQHAPSIPKENFTALTRLDHNRAQALLASRLNVGVNKVKNVIIWGNHSGTQFVDATHAKVDNKPVPQAVNNQNWLNGEFLETIRQRGHAIIAARKTSSAMSAAKAAGDHMRDWWKGTKEGEFVSMGVVSDGSYGMPKDIVYSFPVTISNKEYKIVQGLRISDFAKQKMTETAKELEDERNEANAILNK